MSQETVRLRQVLERIAAADPRLSAEELRNLAGTALTVAPPNEAPFWSNPHIRERYEQVQQRITTAHHEITDWDAHMTLAHLDNAIDHLLSAIMNTGECCARCLRPVYECTCAQTTEQMMVDLNQQFAACIPDDFGGQHDRHHR